MLRFLLFLFPFASLLFSPLIFLISFIAILYGCLTTLRQIDLKKIIAYSSVIHMNYLMFGLFSFNLQGLIGSVILMVGHGFVSGGLFLSVGVLYDRYHTRLIKYYGGLVSVMPIFALFFLIFILANIAFPGTCSFVGEFLIFLSIFKENIIIGTFTAFASIIAASYSIWLYNRIFFKSLNFLFLGKVRDLKKTERIILYPLVFLIIFMGIYPKFFLDISYISVLKITLLYL